MTSITPHLGTLPPATSGTPTGAPATTDTGAPARPAYSRMPLTELWLSADSSRPR